MRAWPPGTAAVHAGISGLFGALGFLVGGLFGVLVGVGTFAVLSRKYVRRLALRRAPFPELWREVLERRVPLYSRLTGERRRRFEDDVRFFLAEQQIYGPRGAEVPETTRVLIGASAAMLTVGRPDIEWPNVRDIVVLPMRFDDEYQLGEGDISGMVHAQGPILLSAPDLKHGFRRNGDGHNVALHELAHVLDFGTGAADGEPVDSWVANAPWLSIIGDRLAKIRRRKYNKTLRRYAATNEAEFFAVAVEAFFEQPHRLSKKDPELYRMLADYFGQDPIDERSSE